MRRSAAIAAKNFSAGHGIGNYLLWLTSSLTPQIGSSQGSSGSPFVVDAGQLKMPAANGAADLLFANTISINTQVDSIVLALRYKSLGNIFITNASDQNRYLGLENGSVIFASAVSGVNISIAASIVSDAAEHTLVIAYDAALNKLVAFNDGAKIAEKVGSFRDAHVFNQLYVYHTVDNWIRDVHVIRFVDQGIAKILKEIVNYYQNNPLTKLPWAN